MALGGARRTRRGIKCYSVFAKNVSVFAKNVSVFAKNVSVFAQYRVSHHLCVNKDRLVIRNQAMHMAPRKPPSISN
jgi:hypothetical protein